MTGKESPMLTEIFTGRMRPRHYRFKKAMLRIIGENKVMVHGFRPGKISRIKMAAGSRWRGFRAVRTGKGNSPYLLHQAINLAAVPYITEFDIPLGLHGYNSKNHIRSALMVRELMEKDSLRTILVFSEWSRSSFELHYGPVVGAKCRVTYPLCSEYATDKPYAERHYDFCFISINFRSKCGPELVKAFQELRSICGSEIKLCIVTRLTEARALLGDLDKYDGIDWRNATLSESDIAQLLASSRCFVLPSLNDSFGVVVLEALAAGCAIISTDIASFPEMVTDNLNGFLLPVPTSAVAGDAFITEYGNVRYFADYLNKLSLHRIVDELLEAMSRIILDENLTRLMMDHSRQLFKARFSEEVWLKKMRSVLIDSFPEFNFAEFLGESEEGSKG